MKALLLLLLLQTQPVQRPVTPPPHEEFVPNKPVNLPTSLVGQDYRIGPDDLLEIRVFEVPELGATTRVSATGVISVPLVGVLEASGKTTQELERAIEEALKKNYIKDPQVTVFIREYVSQPVSVMGAVKNPGIYQIKGQKLLLDMLAMAVGLGDGAGRTIQVIRRHSDPNREPEVISINAEDLVQNGKTELNVPIYAGDVIYVLHAGSIFVVGEVPRPGEFVLRQGKTVTVAQAIALGGGFNREARKKECIIIRFHKDGTKEEIPVNVQKILEGSADDVPMMANDILFVRANKIKSGVNRALDITIAIVSARLIYWR